MRPTCAQCALKHLGQARALLLEARKGYPEHYWFANGHLAEAEDELEAEYPALTATIRQYRKALEDDPDFRVPFKALVLAVAGQTGYDLSDHWRPRRLIWRLSMKFSRFLKFFAPLLIVGAAFGEGLQIVGAPVDNVARAAAAAAVQTEVDPAALPVAVNATNLVAIHAALTSAAHGGVISSNTANALIAAWATTGNAYSATSAGKLSIENGNIMLTITGALLTVTEVTNTTSVRVTATAGEGYNGPAVGTVWVNPVLTLGWDWDESNGYPLNAQPGLTENVFEATDFYVDRADPRQEFLGEGSLPSVLTALYEPQAIGTLTLDWVPSTNTVTFDLSLYALKSGLTTNHTVAVGDVFSITNGVIFSITPAE